jgi:hypothetical protein
MRLAVLVSMLLACVTLLVAERVWSWSEETRSGKAVLVLTMDEVARIEAHLVALQEAVTERQAMLEAQQRELARLRAQKDCS